MLIAVVLLCPGRTWGQAVEFEATVDRTVIPLDGQIAYTLTVRGARDAQPALPEIDGFEAFGRSESTHFSLVNNRTEVIKSIGYNLIPLRVGEFTIPAAKLVSGGKTYYSKPISVRVVGDKAAVPAQPSAGKPQPQQPQVPEEAPPAPRLFVRTRVDKEEAYVNEQITLTFQLFRNRLQIDGLDYTPAPTVGFIEEGLGAERDYQKVVGGMLYDVIELPKAVFPISSGEVTIGSAELKGNILVPSQRRRGFFDDFFMGSYERKPFSLRSKPIVLKIKPLPEEGRPDGFRGAVGSFRLEVSAQPLTVKVGEPITVTTKISGAGNLDSIYPPEIRVGDGFKTYAPEVSTKRSVSAGKIGGEKVFKQVIVPLEVGKLEIPAVSFSYFDPEAGKYRTVEKASIPITVGAAPAEENLALIEALKTGGNKERIELLQKDILYIKDSPGDLRRAGRPFYRNFLYRAAHPAALILLLAVWAVRARRDRLKSDVIYARRVGASRAVRKRFKTARRWLGEGDAEKYYGEVHRALTRYLGDKLGLPSGAVDPDTVRRKLSARGASSELLDKLTGCFETCNHARFAPGRSEKGEMKKFLASLEGLIARMEKLKLK